MASLFGEVEELKRLLVIDRKTGNRNGSSVKVLARDATKAGCLTDSKGIISKVPIVIGKES